VVHSGDGLLDFIANYRHPPRKWTAIPHDPPPP
jgi:hypothetical protein